MHHSHLYSSLPRRWSGFPIPLRLVSAPLPPIVQSSCDTAQVSQSTQAGKYCVDYIYTSHPLRWSDFPGRSSWSACVSAYSKPPVMLVIFARALRLVNAALLPIYSPPRLVRFSSPLRLVIAALPTYRHPSGNLVRFSSPLRPVSAGLSSIDTPPVTLVRFASPLTLVSAVLLLTYNHPALVRFSSPLTLVSPALPIIETPPTWSGFPVRSGQSAPCYRL